MGWEDFEGIRRTARRASSLGTILSDRAGICDPDRIGIFNRQGYGGQAEESCRLSQTIIAYWYRMSSVTYKWFGCCGLTVGRLDRRWEIRGSRSRKWTKSQKSQVQMTPGALGFNPVGIAMTRILEKKDSENPRPTLQLRGWGTPRLCALADIIEVVRSLRSRCQQIQTPSTRPPADDLLS